MSNKIIKTKYFVLQIKAASPICVSSGESDYTDSDVMRNGYGEIFIPGTSLAGAFRNYTEQKKDENSIFGYSRGEEGQMSSVFISDLYFDKEEGLRISERDQVQLDRNKQVKNKFDTEILETGAKGNLYFHYVVREKGKSEAEFDREIKGIVKAIQEGHIRIGSNKNRGFGRLKVSDVKSRVFTKDNLDEMIQFKSDYKNMDQYHEEKELNDTLKADMFEQSKYIKISVPLKLSGGISIRRYSTEPDKADYEHIKCNNNPVIPGSSWNGAIREMCIRILEELLIDSDIIEKYMDQWFGFVKIGDKESELKATQSMIVFGESILQGGKEKVLSRNKVNRFDGSTINGALYTEKAYFGGTTTLEIMIRKNEPEYKALAGLIELVIEDIKEGYVAVGGQAAIGRGIFEAVDVEKKEYQWQWTEHNEKYGQALYQLFESDMCKGEK